MRMPRHIAFTLCCALNCAATQTLLADKAIGEYGGIAIIPLGSAGD
jgi:hypothetical protein